LQGKGRRREEKKREVFNEPFSERLEPNKLKWGTREKLAFQKEKKCDSQEKKS